MQKNVGGLETSVEDRCVSARAWHHASEGLCHKNSPPLPKSGSAKFQQRHVQERHRCIGDKKFAETTEQSSIRSRGPAIIPEDLIPAKVDCAQRETFPKSVVYGGFPCASESEHPLDAWSSNLVLAAKRPMPPCLSYPPT